MNKRMSELLNELNIDKNDIFTVDSEKILSAVSEKIDREEKGKVISFRQTAKLLPMVCALAVLLLMAVTTVAFNTEGGFWKKIFPLVEESTDTYDLYAVEDRRDYNKKKTEIPTEEETDIITPKYEAPLYEIYHKEEPEKKEEPLVDIYASCEGEDYTLILNEVTGDNKNVHLTVTIEANDRDARELLDEQDDGWFEAQAYDEEKGWIDVSFETEESESVRRENSRTYKIHIFGDDHLKSGYEKMRITCTEFPPDMGDERYIYFETAKQEGVIEFDLAGQDFTGGYIYITPMSIELTAPKEPTAQYAPDARNLNTFFKFKNGTIKTMNQVAGVDGSFSYIGGDDKLYKFSAGTKTVLNTETLASVIVKGIEYPVDDPANYSYTEIPENLKPFVVAGEGKRSDEFYYTCTVGQLDPCISVIHEEADLAEFTYGGKTYLVESDNLTVIINGATEYTLYLAPYADEDGNLWIGSDFLNYVLGIRYDEIGDTGTYLMVP